MSAEILAWGIFAARLLIGCACLALTYRLLRGPKAQDRIMALDSLYIAIMLLFIIFGISRNSDFYFESALMIAMLGFVSTIALAKFLMRGEVIE